MNTNTTTARRVRAAVVVATACAAVTVTAPRAVAGPQGDGAEPGPTQHAVRPDPAPPTVVPAFDVRTDAHQCFSWRGTWNVAEGPEPTCAESPAMPQVELVPELGGPPCGGVVEAGYVPTSGTDPDHTVCAPDDHWWDFVPA